MSFTLDAETRGTAGRVAPPRGEARLLRGSTLDLAGHAHLVGPLPWRGGPGLLVEQVQLSGLTGHGGAGFPTARKMSATLAAGTWRRRPVVVANAAEGEPASAKDVTLLVAAPHLVLDGLQLAAEAVGADTAYLYVKAGPAAVSARRALAARKAARWDRRRVRVHEATDSFVAGEESAVVAALEGGPALPRTKHRLLVESGLHGRPTLVSNVETLAHLALLARFGADWFRELGTSAEPGTFLATVAGAVASPGVVEAPYGVPLRDLLARTGGPTAPLRALLVGGYHGAWLPADAAAGLPMSREALDPYGAAPGAGVVVALPRTACGLDATARLVAYLAGQSARQCGPCVHGLPRLADALAALAWGPPRSRSVHDVGQLAGLVDGRGACRHPDGTVRLVRSALRTFADDVRAHTVGACTAQEA